MADVPPDYEGASRYVQACHYRAGGGRAVRRIVLHITDGHPQTDKTVLHFATAHPDAPASAHFVVGQDGEVVQMVRLRDIAFHASAANADSVGIEHCARRPGEWDHALPPGHHDPGLPLTEVQLRASARLAAWLCDRYGLPLDRAHIVGHCEADPTTSHKDCPNSIWPWDRYLQMVAEAAEPAPAGDRKES